LDSDLSFSEPSWPLLFCLLLSELLFIRKKFLILCDTWLLDTVLFVDSGIPLNARFSAGSVELCELEPKICVIAYSQGN
jgi:hypothetical protein